MTEYNAAQEEAVKTHAGQLLLISCPGSGKTTTMLRRIFDMTESGIDPSGILMVTFTESAAREMRERYRRDYGESSAQFQTLHALSLRILRENGFERQQVLSGEQQRSYVAELIRKHARNPFDLSVKDLLLNISAFKNKDIPMNSFECSGLDKDELRTLLPLYEARKKENGQIDFDDMILQCRSLLRESPTVCAHYRRLFPYLICDEYQDTNRIQRDILYLLAGKDGNLCVVGDDDQSIYSFRGADSRSMPDFRKHFPHAKTLCMNSNYRSLPRIVEQSRRLIEHNALRFPKDIRAARSGEGRVEQLHAASRTETLQKLCEKLRELRAEGQPLRNTAVLTRTNAQLEDIAAYLEAQSLPYHAAESLRDPYEHFIFRDLLCYLRLIQGKRWKEDLLRVLNRPNHYVKLQSIISIDTWTDSNLNRIMEAEYPSSPRIVNHFRRYLRKLHELKGRTLSAQLAGIYDEIDYRSYLRDYAKSSGTEFSALEAKLRFYEEAAAHCGDLSSWYQAAVSHVERHRASLRSGGEGVRLCTMHQAKGLEWDTVFIMDCVMGITPSPLARSFTERQEERRLFYVAMTRARDSLYLLRYTENQAKPSIYLREMEEKSAGQSLDAPREDSEAASKARLTAVKRRSSPEKKQFFREGSTSGFTVGLSVHHLKFGEGRVIQLTERTVHVDFSGTIRIFKR